MGKSKTIEEEGLKKFLEYYGIDNEQLRFVGLIHQLKEDPIVKAIVWDEDEFKIQVKKTLDLEEKLELLEKYGITHEVFPICWIEWASEKVLRKYGLYEMEKKFLKDWKSLPRCEEEAKARDFYQHITFQVGKKEYRVRIYQP